MSSQFDETLHPRNSNGSGQFTEKPAADPGSSLLTAGIEPMVRAVIEATGASEQEAREAVNETSDLPGAIRHATLAAQVRMHLAAAGDALKSTKAFEQITTDHAVQAAVTLILMRYPEANRLELADECGDGNFQWTVFVDGDEQPLEGSIEDDLWNAMATANYRMPLLLAKWCSGYNPEGSVYDTSGLEVDSETSTLDRAIINLDLFRGERAE